MKIVFIFIIFVLYISPIAEISARELSVAFPLPKPPFVTDDEKYPGIEVEVVKESFKVAGYKVLITFASNRRIKKEVISGGVDASAAVRPEKGDSGIYYSDSYIKLHNFAFSKKSKDLKINNVADLINHSIAAWQGAFRDLAPEYYRYFNPANESEYKRYYYEKADQRAQVMMFWSDRVDVVVIDIDILNYMTHKMPSHIDISDEIQSHNIFTKETLWYVAFNDQKIRDDFNSGLKTIRSNGVYDGIINKYKELSNQISKVDLRYGTTIP